MLDGLLLTGIIMGCEGMVVGRLGIEWYDMGQ
jgi:hypothetical protein